MSYLKVKLIHSTNSCTQDMRATVKSIGFRRLYEEKIIKNTPEIRGMVKKVIHLVKVLEDVR